MSLKRVNNRGGTLRDDERFKLETVTVVLPLFYVPSLSSYLSWRKHIGLKESAVHIQNRNMVLFYQG